MFPLIRGWTDVQRSPKAHLGLGLVLSFVAGATNAGGFLAVGFLLGGLVGALGFKHGGYITTLPLAALLWILCLRPLLTDLRARAK